MTPFGISVALLSPFDANGALSTEMLARHALAVLDEGAHGVTLFGTTGEGASIGLDERALGLASILDAGIGADEIVLGICGTSVEDVAAQVKQGVEAGVVRFLALPPFYFPDAEDDGLFLWFKKLFLASPPSARFILYHIPQVTGVPLSIDLVLRLKAAFSDRVLAIKDSSGSWENVQALLETGEISVLVGDERLLHRALALGASGSICGLANLYPSRMRRIYDTQRQDPKLNAEVDMILSHPVMPALKAVLANATGDENWKRLRAPLTSLTSRQYESVLSQSIGTKKEFSWAKSP